MPVTLYAAVCKGSARENMKDCRHGYDIRTAKQNVDGEQACRVIWIALVGSLHLSDRLRDTFVPALRGSWSRRADPLTAGVMAPVRLVQTRLHAMSYQEEVDAIQNRKDGRSQVSSSPSFLQTLRRGMRILCRARLKQPL